MARKRSRQLGFTLIETLIAITVLAVGMLGLAALLSQMDTTSGKSRYMSMQALMASEKLEQLNRYPASDSNIAVTTGTTAGSLTQDLSSDSTDYFDEVLVSSSDGSIAETSTGKDADGKTVYTTITQTRDGKISTDTSDKPPTTATTLAFKRRWLIEKDKPVAGVSRITVAVILQNAGKNPVTDLQMSMVRQYAQ